MDGITSFLILQYSFTSVCSAACLQPSKVSCPGLQQADKVDTVSNLMNLTNALQNLCLSSPCKKVCLLEIFNRDFLFFFLEGSLGWQPDMFPILHGKEVKFPPSSFPLHINQPPLLRQYTYWTNTYGSISACCLCTSAHAASPPALAKLSLG